MSIFETGMLFYQSSIMKQRLNAAIRAYQTMQNNFEKYKEKVLGTFKIEPHIYIYTMILAGGLL